MYSLHHHTSFCLLNHSDLTKAVLNPMCCISLPLNFVVQTPAFGVNSNVRRKKKQVWGLVSKQRHSFTINALSASRVEHNMVVKGDTGFKSSFDEHLEAMGSISFNHEKKKKNVHERSDRGKNRTDAAFSKDAARFQKRGDEAVKYRWVKSSDSKVNKDAAFNKDAPRVHKRGDEAVKSRWVKSSDSKVNNKMPARSDGVADQKKFGGSIQTRSSVRSEKNPIYVGSKNDLSKKVDVHAAASKNSEFVKKKINSMNGMSIDNDLETRNSVSSEKKLSYVGSKNGMSKKVYVRAAASRSSELGKKKIKSMNEMNVGNNLETRDSVRSETKLSYVGSKNGLSKKVYVRAATSKSYELGKKKLKSVNEMSVGDDLERRNNVRSEKDLRYLGSKKVDVRPAASKSELVKKKMKPMNEMIIDDDLEMDRFNFLSSDDGLDVPRVSQMEMEERIQKLAIRLNNADVSMPQWMFAKAMRSARIRYSDHSMLRVIQILGKFRNWQRVLQLIEWFQMQERYKSRKIRYVYTAALDVLGKAKRPVEALNLFYAMQRHSSTYPDIVTYHSIAITLGQAGHMKELFDVIDSMRSMPKNFKIDVLEDWDPRLEPDVVIYNAVLNGCVKRKESEGAVWVLQKLEESGQQPSSATYGLVMEVMLACGKYDLVHKYFKLMQRSSVPNALTYRVVVNTFWREGKADEAIAAVQDMERRGVIGSASLYYDLARCLCSVGRCDEGLMQVDKICNVASKRLVVTYTGLIQACIANGLIHDATSIFNLMQKHCSPNTVTCNIMLKGYLGYGLFDEAKDLFQKMTHNEHESSKVRNKIRPDVHTFNTMLEAYIREKSWDDFEYAYEQMLQHQYPFNTKRHLWMVLQASGAGKVEAVEITWSHLVETNRVPPPKLVKERFRLKMENDNFVEAVSSVARHPSTHQQSFSKESWLQLLKDNAHSFKKEALEHLIQEVNKFLSMSESPNLIFQNLLDSCMEFVRHDILVTSTA